MMKKGDGKGAVVALLVAVAIAWAAASAATDGHPRYGEWRTPGDRNAYVQMGGRVGADR